jgi:Cof subfamily protein (haloacid dehalogenase superfamily)
MAARRPTRGREILTGPRDIRLLLSDVDGTLVTNDKVLTEAAKAAVADLHKAGVAFAVTSSRPPRGMRMLVEPLALREPLAGVNGGVYVQPDLSVIETHKLDPAAAKRVVAFLLAQKLDVWVYTETDWFIRDPVAPHVARETFILQFDAVVVAGFTDAQLADAVKIVGVSDDFAQVAAAEVQAQGVLGASVSATRSAAHFLDVTNPEANKGAVALTLAKRLGISPDQIATIGDMPNDVLMFKKTGLSIAMGNASDAVKAEATHVTDTNENDGFAKAVRNFILPAVAQ